MFIRNPEVLIFVVDYDFSAQTSSEERIPLEARRTQQVILRAVQRLPYFDSWFNDGDTAMLGGLTIWGDIRYAVRIMCRTPLFTATVVLTVAIAIAANATIFTIVNAAMIRSLPYAEPNRIMQVVEKNDKLNLPTFAASVLNFLSWRELTQSFEQLAGVGYATFTLSGSGEPEQLSGNRISPVLTRVLGTRLIAGREFRADEEKPGGAAVAMIGEGLWKRRFAADPALVGKTISLDGVPTTIVGIAPASLKLIGGGDVYMPLTIDPSKELRLNHVITVFGKLKPGVTPQQAQAEMDTISARVGQQYPEVRYWGIHLLSLFDTFVAPDLKTGLVVLLVAVEFVLLIACANIANLLLARAATRQKEMAVRTALGATRSRLIRQLLVESVALAILGGGLGLLGALGAVRVLTRSLPEGTLPFPDVSVDSSVLWFGFALTIATGLLFGLAPAWRIATAKANDMLKEGGRGSTGGIRSWLRDSLAAGEVALATVLLIGAGLLLQSLAHLQRVALGFDSSGLMTFQLAPPVPQYPLADKGPNLYHALVEDLQSIPGVLSATVCSGIPFGAGNYARHPMITTEASVLPPGTAVPVDWRSISPGYFDTMRIPLLRGRTFTDGDVRTAPLVMVVSQSTAQKFFGDADPIGKTLRPSAKPELAYAIIGVVGDVRDQALNQQTPTLYYSIPQRGSWPLMDVVVRTEAGTDGSAEALMPSIRQRIHDLDAGLALANVKTMDQWLSNSAAQPRLNTVLLTTFAAIALLIAAIGIYGVLAYSVNQRTREIGLRMALGATPGSVLQLIVSQGMKMVLVGIGIGLAGGLASGRAVSSLVFGVPVRDPTTFSLVSVVLIGVALAACIVPARRAARVDPMVALREE
ncbi:MAG TPA: ABC transporter permease [Bryobacteraceae bacterium]|nr:ABC transporter permease [Bryobacteraceae bacterium]